METQNNTEPRRIVFNPSAKQYEAYQYLTDKETTEIGYGGAAYGGKSYLGCFWLISSCLAYPDTGWLLGRKDLINLKRTTLLTFFKLLEELGIKRDEYNYNQQQNIITFSNKSQIFLFDLAQQPSDPLFTRLGGLELTGGFIDESNEVPEQAISIVLTRIGRRNNEKYGLLPKLLEGFNPDKGHVYGRFYKLWRDNALPVYRKFIKALPTDNPTVTEQYLNQLRNSDKVTRERLLLGNFEYDDDPTALMGYDSIIDLFTNTVIEGEKYLTADIARYGQDKTVICLWKGLHAYAIHEYAKQGLDVTAGKIQEFARNERIPFSHIIVDEDGVGGGVVDSLRGIKGFTANAKALENKITHEGENYANLKAQCTYKLADLVNNHKVAVTASQTQKTAIIEELEQIKTKDIDKDRKLQIRPKDEIKEVLGRSPDYADCFIAGTQVMTPWGNRSIETLKVGDYVLTPFGTSKIGRTICKQTTEVYELNNELMGTGNHKLFTFGGLKRLDEHSHQEYNYRYSITNLFLWKYLKKLLIKDSSIGFKQIMEVDDITTIANKELYTGLSGRLNTKGKYLWDMKFIMLTVIATTMIPSILNWLKEAFTKKNIGAKSRNYQQLAKNVSVNFTPIFPLEKEGNSAQTNVSNAITIKTRLTTQLANVFGAKNPFRLSKASQLRPVQSLALHTLGNPINVYTLTLEKDNAYFANGYLVENCLMMRMFFELKPATQQVAKQFYPTLTVVSPAAIVKNPTRNTQYYPTQKYGKVRPNTY